MKPPKIWVSVKVTRIGKLNRGVGCILPWWWKNFKCLLSIKMVFETDKISQWNWGLLFILSFWITNKNCTSICASINGENRKAVMDHGTCYCLIIVWWLDVPKELGVLLNETVDISARNFVENESLLTGFPTLVSTLHQFFSLVHNAWIFRDRASYILDWRAATHQWPQPVSVM